MHRNNPDPRDALWTFETENLAVCYFALPEDLDPADSFESDEDIEAVRSGAVDWFCACVAVYAKTDEPSWRWPELASDYLGGCAYKSAASFAEGENRSGYFRDMVREACSNARAELRRLKTIPLRSAA